LIAIGIYSVLIVSLLNVVTGEHQPVGGSTEDPLYPVIIVIPSRSSECV
jgi:hypothetical protein